MKVHHMSALLLLTLGESICYNSILQVDNLPGAGSKGCKITKCRSIF